MPERKITISEKDGCSRCTDNDPCKIEEWKVFLPQARARFDKCWNNTPLVHPEKLGDFVQVTLLGSGSFGDVILIKHKENDHLYAMKAIKKEQIIKPSKRLDHVKNEKKILQCIDFPFTVYLEFFFKDNSYIYIVMPFVVGGELFRHLKKLGKFNEVQARFFTSQVILALEYLHYLDLIYRDLKPENILVDHTGYLKVADFGFCKRLTKDRTYTLCGTPEYLAPEVILSNGYGKAVDWWAIGVLIYEMVAGVSPFYAINDMKIYESVVSGKFKMPPHFSNELKDLEGHILQVDVTRRYGNLKNGADDIKGHSWFKPVNWLAVLNRKVTAPFKPKYSTPGDVGNFEKSKWTPPRIAKENLYEAEFADF